MMWEEKNRLPMFVVQTITNIIWTLNSIYLNFEYQTTHIYMNNNGTA